MSVINKMLQDLDKRQERAGIDASQGGVANAPSPARRWSWRTVLLGLGALTAVALAAGNWMQDGGAGVLRHWSGQTPPSGAGATVQPAAAAAAPTPPSPTRPTPPPLPAPTLPPTAIAPAATSATAALPSLAPAPSASPAPAPPAAAEPAARTTARALAAPLPAPAVAAAPRSAPAALSSPGNQPPAEPAPARTRQAKSYSPTQVSGNLLGEAVVLDQQGRLIEAKALLERSLKAYPHNADARQMLIQLHLDTGRLDEAQALLAEGLQQHPERSGFWLAMARLQLERGDVADAVKTLQGGLPRAADEPQYHATLAALQLRLARHDEALRHYLVALRADPAFTPWLVGTGLAFEGLGRNAEATEAYRRADSSGHGSTPELARFVQGRLAVRAATSR